ncbi:MAG: ChbG/HpnK family deacetylase [Legionellaceae bacterium]
MSISSKTIVLCADDYAQNDEISRGILSAVDARRINAVSCMTNVSDWPKHALPLLARRSHVFIGLHFNLSHGLALSHAWKVSYGEQFGGLFSLIRSSYGHQLDPYVIKAECVAQLEAFRSELGVYPDFIDGHQHVHQLPQMRDVLLDVYKINQLTGFIRNTAGPFGFSKAYALACLGGMTLKRRLMREGISTNASFSGVYPFHRAINYRHYFNYFLEKSKDKGLIMSHPGFQSVDPSDPLNRFRYHELDYFMSDAFLDDSAFHGVSYAPICR